MPDCRLQPVPPLETYVRGYLRLPLCLVFAAGVAAAAASAGDASAGPPVEVLALFKDRAVLRGHGGEQMLHAGETSRDGVTLLQANAGRARVEYHGEVFDLPLSRQVSARFHPVEPRRIAISSDAQGQYRIRGAINGVFVDFLVDTGASVVAMSRAHARTLGLDPERGDRGMVQTAQGTVASHFVTLDTVVVAGITVHHVRAAVIDGDYPAEILLGMSFLHSVGMEESQGVLTLTAKH